MSAVALQHLPLCSSAKPCMVAIAYAAKHRISGRSGLLQAGAFTHEWISVCYFHVETATYLML